MKQFRKLLQKTVRGMMRGFIQLYSMALTGGRTPAVKLPEYQSHRVPTVSRRTLRKYEGLESKTNSPVVAQSSDFEVADQIVAIRFDPPVGVVHMRVYNASRVVKRELLIHEPVLKGIMKGRRFTLPDAPYDPAKGMDVVKEETVELAEKLINEIGNRNVKGVKPLKQEPRAKSETSEAKAETRKDKHIQEIAPKGAAQGAPAVKSQPAREMRPSKTDISAIPADRVFKPRVSTGLTYVGRLKRAQHRTISPPGRSPYETYEATILMDNGAELPMRGAELEREIELAGCRVGDTVAITPMGKVPVSLPDGKEGSKNLYKVERLEST